MRFQRRSAVAMAATTSATLFVGVLAAVNVFDLPVLGFNSPSRPQALVAGSPDMVPSTTLSGAVTPAPERVVEAAATPAEVVAGVAPTPQAVPAPVQQAPVQNIAPGALPSASPAPPSASVTIPRSPTTTRPTTTTRPPTTTTTRPTTTTTVAARCSFTGIDTKGKYTNGGIEVEKGTNLATKVTITTSGTCTGTMTMTFAAPSYTLTLSPNGSGTSWTGTIPKGALRGLGADQQLSATLSVGGAADAQVSLRTVVRSGSSSS